MNNVHVAQEEVLFTWPETHVSRSMPVTFITYPSGGYSLHSQTGTHHKEAIEIASKMLAWRGLVVGKPILLGPSGQYYEVTKS
jgi:hypothetical protein